MNLLLSCFCFEPHQNHNVLSLDEHRHERVARKQSRLQRKRKITARSLRLARYIRNDLKLRQILQVDGTVLALRQRALRTKDESRGER